MALNEKQKLAIESFRKQFRTGVAKSDADFPERKTLSDAQKKMLKSLGSEMERQYCYGTISSSRTR